MNKQNGWISQLPEDFLNYLGTGRIEEVECITPDFVGTSRGKTIPARKFNPDLSLRLPISIFYQTISGEYVDMDIENQWLEYDVTLKPDMSTATAVPWSDDPTMQVICDVVNDDSSPVEISPRNVLRKVLSLYDKLGWKPIVAPELEFFITKRTSDPNMPIEPPLGRTGRPTLNRQLYSMAAVDEHGPIIDTIYEYAEHQGLKIDSVIQEDGASQLEINLQHGNPLSLADDVFYFKRTIREAALKNNVFATFMAKPMRDQPGSAMHIHQSIVDAKTGRNIFSGTNGEPTSEFYHFIGGQQHHLNDVCPIFAPYVNSYRRLTKYPSETRINVEWGQDNRSVGLRIPRSAPEARRVENRIIGMDCNPYLAIAASLACGLYGIQTKATPRDAINFEVHETEQVLPDSMHDSLELFNSATEIRKLLGETFCQVFGAIKLAEYNEYQREITPWERQYLLLNA